MEAYDVRGEVVSIGSFARYGGTGTIGQISDIKEDNNNTWAKFEKNSLWYSLDTLEVINQEDIKKYSNTDDRDKAQKVKDLKSDVKDNALANAMDIDACGAG
jgi:hypothetical protein